MTLPRSRRAPPVRWGPTSRASGAEGPAEPLRGWRALIEGGEVLGAIVLCPGCGLALPVDAEVLEDGTVEGLLMCDPECRAYGGCEFAAIVRLEGWTFGRADFRTEEQVA